MTQGGTHPRKKTNITVPAIDADFDTSMLAAAKIFYDANTNCLTESSSFYSARLCTLMFAGDYNQSVSAAWDAVGVVKINFRKLQNNLNVTRQSSAAKAVRYYSLSGVKAGETVTCMTYGDNGDADMFVRVGTVADPAFASTANDCASGF